jgi:hypothetical protein
MNIKELAAQANSRFEHTWPGGVIWYWDELAKFAELVAAHEREECAQVCEDAKQEYDCIGRERELKYTCATDIRARSKT